jgi:FAD-dependent urate hydroxylase
MTAKRMNACEVVIVGAGPYGLSVAAHLKDAGISTRVFGEPMSFWRDHMPKGMIIRSPWRATELSAPDRKLSLDVYAAMHGGDVNRRLPLKEFIAYGDWFCRNAAPDVDRRMVCRIDAADAGFRLELADGEVFAADRVVIATGLARQAYRPPVFGGLSTELVTHSCDHADFAPFAGKRVAVIGGGQSACESAVLLSEAGATVELISTRPIHWLAERSAYPTLRQRAGELVASPSAVGPFPLSWLAEFPGTTPYLPQPLRESFTVRCLKPGAAGWLRHRFGAVKLDSGRTIRRASAEGGRVTLELDSGEAAFDHVVLGTGYRVDIAKIGILSAPLLERIATRAGSPLLGRGFESSVPKLHFAGSYAVTSFGPLLRFIAGTPFAARAVTRAVLGRKAQQKSATRDFDRAAAAAPPQ